MRASPSNIRQDKTSFEIFGVMLNFYTVISKKIGHHTLDTVLCKAYLRIDGMPHFSVRVLHKIDISQFI